MSQRFPPHRGYTRPHPSRFEHSDRWNGNRAGERSRSPIRDRRDSRDFAPPPRDFPPERPPPRFPRDGPPSAGPNTPAQRFPQPTYGRGRGRPQDWDFRGRPGRYPEEREPFRRSPSRGPPPRRERQGSVDSRDFDRRDDRRDEYRERHDDDWRFRGRNDYPLRRDPPPRIDTRHASDARSDSVPSPTDRSGRLPSPHRRPSPVDTRDYDTTRRASMMDHSNKDGRRESGRSDPGRPPRDRSPDPPPVRPAAEETSSVAVPQFGFIPPILPATPAKTPVSPIPISKPIPTAPRALLPVNIPTGPKAERIAEQQPSFLNKETVQSPIEEQRPELPVPVTVSVNISPAALSHPTSFQQESPSLSRIQSLENSVSPRVQQLVPPTAPSGPRSSSQPLRASSAGPPGRSLSPSIPFTPSAPRGPFVQQPPKGLPENIPTGPRAMSRVPPTAPRNHRQQVTSLQWRPNQLPIISQRAPSLGVKRDANGEEKEKTPVPERLLEPNRAPSYGFENKRPLESPLQAFASLPNRIEKQDEDVQMVDALPKPSPISPDPSINYLLSDDDEGQGLDEEDFAREVESYRRRKAELEAQLEVLDRRHRAVSPLQELDKANAILAILDEIGLQLSPEPSPEPSPQPIPEVIMTEDVPEDVTLTTAPTPEEPKSPAAAVEEQVPKPDIPPVVARELTPEMSKSPDYEYLPYLPDQPPTPVSNPDHIEPSPDDDLTNLVQERLQQLDDEENDHQYELTETYVHLYKPWRTMTFNLENERDRHLAQSTEIQPAAPIEDPEPAVDQIVPPLLTPTESRRLHRYASELDLERALEESRREEEERRLRVEKEKMEALAHVEREADIPNLLRTYELELGTFRDTSLQRLPSEALHIFEFEPPVDNFTEAQSREFTRLWRGHPKMWHKIADDLGISTKDCIYHYYATKWDKPYKQGKQRRPRKPVAGRRGAMLGGRMRLDADNDSTDAATGLTETGRPRRAAAPTFSKPVMGKGDTEAEVEVMAPAGRRTAGKSDGTADGKGGTRGKSAKERPGRKPKNQSLAAKPLAAASPQKIAREKKEKPGSIMPTMMGEPENWVTKVENVPQQDRPMPVLIPHQQHQQYQQMQQLQQPQMYMSEPMVVPHYRAENPNLAPMDPNPSPASARPRSYSNTQKNNASSYWSVTEESEFQACLGYYGTDFNQISVHINKKTPVMIKNHFQKYRADEDKYRDVLIAADAADAKRQRGELPGEMPIVLKKAIQIVPGGFRTLMPNDQMDLDSPPSMKNFNVMHGSPSLSARPIFPQGLQPHSTPPSQASVLSHNMPGQPAQPALKQPRMGYFPDTSPIRLQGQPSSHAPHMSPPTIMMQEPSRGPKHVSRIKTEHDPHRPVHQPIGRERSNTGNALTAAQRQQDIPTGLAPYPTGIPMASNSGGAPIRLVAQTYNLQDHQTFERKELLPAGPVTARSIIDLTGTFDPQGHRPQTPSIREMGGPRYHQQNITPLPPKARDPPVSDPPPRRVDIMSMLNSEPAEDKSRREPEPPSRSTHTPTEHMGIQRDPYGREPSHRPQYSIHDRPMSTAPEQSAPSHRESGWSSSRPYAPGYPAHNNSPHLAPQPNSTADYRHAALSQLNTHASRMVPSPPPGGPAYHSRTPSYSAAHQQQLQQHQHKSNPPSQTGTPTEAYSRSSLRGSVGPNYTPGPPLAPSQNQQHSRDSPYASGPPPPAAIYADRRVDDQSSIYPPLRAFRNTNSHDYVADPREGGPPAPPGTLFGPGGQQQHSSPQPPTDGRFAPPMRYERSRGPGDEREQMYHVEEMRRREEEIRRSSGGPVPGPNGQGQPPTSQAQRRY